MEQAPFPPIEEKKKKNTTLIVIILVLLVLCCCCIALGIAGYQYGDLIMQSLGAY